MNEAPHPELGPALPVPEPEPEPEPAPSHDDDLLLQPLTVVEVQEFAGLFIDLATKALCREHRRGR
jgi:hypothetical protein